ncbi:MAG: YfiR family protein [Chitinophagaceae bacterium]|nr:YfiR family protein [Chitinophagaceae bacterium]
MTQNLQAQRATEYQVKAAFILNFSKFVEWPGDAFARQSDIFILGVLGKDPFGDYLDEIVEGEKIEGKKLIIQRYNSVDDIHDCQILFINVPEETGAVIKRLKGRSILTVSDDADFSRAGGIIQFYKQDDAIRLQINPDAAKEANLTLSSKLLRIAKIDESDIPDE